MEGAAHEWDRLVEEQRLEEFRLAGKAAATLGEQARRGNDWDRANRARFGLTEGGDAPVTWQADQEEFGHQAEPAAFAATLALSAQDQHANSQLEVLVARTGEMLPWLLSWVPGGSGPTVTLRR